MSLTTMSRDQRQHFAEFERIWPRYAAMLRGREETTGGMQWKPGTGAEYLTRYWPDPLTGKRTVKSLGRRSPETEALYREFFDRRRGVHAETAELESKAEVAGSFARALRLTRLPAKYAEGLRNIHEAGRFDDGGVLVSGVAAILLYEAKARVLTPNEVIRDDDALAFLLPGPGRLAWDDCMAFAIAFGGRKAYVETLDSDDFNRRMSVDGMTITLFSRGGLVEAAHALGATSLIEETLLEFLRLPSIEGFVFAKNATVAPVRAPDPRAFCLMAPLVAGEDEDRLRAAWRRVDAVADIVRGHWPADPLTRRMVDAVDELRECVDPDKEGVRPGP
jgi:hypothetical protein